MGMLVIKRYTPDFSTLMELPLFLCRIPAGFPSPADDYLDEFLDLNQKLISAPLMTDPLAQFRKVAAEPQAAVGEDSEPVEYVAFETKDDLYRLVIECGDDQELAPLYQYLMDVVCDGKHGTRVILVYTFMMVYIRGRNLYSMVKAIRGHHAYVIRQFGKPWSQPKDTSAAFIEEIEITTQDLGKSITQSKKKLLQGETA